jgi:hypothetical protein
MKKLSLLLSAFALVSCATSAPRVERSAVDSLLDGWHRAASRADEAAYFGAMADESVFLGTDATERWTKQQFIDWSKQYFDRDTAWTFTPRSRNVIFSRDGRVAWFDEVLDSKSYGECRGTGVVQWDGSQWKIEHYNLTIPIPNDLADEFVKRIRER